MTSDRSRDGEGVTSRFVSLETRDVRFPTSHQLDGSDAMNPDPDYPAAYVVLRTDAVDGQEGHGFAFTIGRGNKPRIDKGKGAPAPFPLQRIPHRGACGKTPVMPQNRRP
jgi:hypothetical protein